MAFLAIDFETADYGRDSACALGLARADENGILSRTSFLIRPPRKDFVFTYIHGISWEDVVREPTFGELWPLLAPHFQDVDFIAAHNATFDQGVLLACCAAAGVSAPGAPFRCTMRLARQVWGIYPTRLPDVCRRLGIPLNHHEALSDTLACASIMVRALQEKPGR